MIPTTKFYFSHFENILTCPATTVTLNLVTGYWLLIYARVCPVSILNDCNSLCRIRLVIAYSLDVMLVLVLTPRWSVLGLELEFNFHENGHIRSFGKLEHSKC